MDNFIKNLTRHIEKLPSFIEGEPFEIILEPLNNEDKNNEVESELVLNSTYTFIVKNYMTKKATANFDFMEKWNNNNPLPCTEITGKIIKETKGMIYIETKLGNWWIIKSAILSQELLN